MTEQPRVTDNDNGEIAVTLDGCELRGWIYKDDAERRTKRIQARAAKITSKHSPQDAQGGGAA